MLFLRRRRTRAGLHHAWPAMLLFGLLAALVMMAPLAGRSRAQPTLPVIRLSELMVNPAAVSDTAGEWIELTHVGAGHEGAAAVNLDGWHLASQNGSLHQIVGDLWISPGQSLVLARVADPAQNGGLQPDYLYADLELGNEADGLALRRADGSPVDQVTWGGSSGLAIPEGASIERPAFDQPDHWQPASAPWPGSLGDRGTPHVAPAAPAPPTPTATDTPSTEPSATATGTATPTPSGTATATETPLPAPSNTPTLADTSTPTFSPSPLPTATATASETATSTPPPSATPTATPVATATATPLPTPTATHTPSSTATTIPTATASATPSATETAKFTPTAIPTVTSTGTPTLTPTLTPTFVPAATPTATPSPMPTATAIPPRIRFSEIMVNPAAAEDKYGEWIELMNLDQRAVNLRTWRMQDQGAGVHQIAGDLWLQPGQIVVLGRHGASERNGGLAPDYVYADLELSNEDDGLLLLAPDGQVVDAVQWGSAAALAVVKGASLERPDMERPDWWQPAHTPWPGSAGDRGSPHSPYHPPPTATSSPSPTVPPPATEIPTATASPIPTGTARATATATAVPTLVESPTPVPTPTPLPTATIPPHAPMLRIVEFLADPIAVADAQGEWVEVANLGGEPVNLRGWMLADLDSDHHTIGADLWLAPGARLVLGRSADQTLNGGVTVAYVYSGLQLANGVDELLLLTPWGVEVDRVLWGEGTGQPVVAGAAWEWNEHSNWQLAWQVWPGSSGDRGSPGRPYMDPPPTSTATQTPTQGLATPTPTASPAPTASPTVTAPPAQLPRIRISELMADPAAVADETGEWLELYHAGATRVNLHGWILADRDHDRHTIATELWIEPGGYLLLARHGDASANGGIQSHYVYSGLVLANENDELLLYAPWGALVDTVGYGEEAGIAVPSGASLERHDFAKAARWQPAHSPWPGSLGDRGSPGQPYQPPQPQPRPTVTVLLPTSTPTAVPLLPTPTPSPSPSLTTTATPPDTLPRLRISEIMANPAAVADSAGEWCELFNDGPSAVNLQGWSLRDEQGEAFTVADELWLAPGAFLVLARNDDPATNGGLPAATRYTGLQLANAADELLLVSPWGDVLDAVRWGPERGLSIVAGASLQRTTFDGAGQWVRSTQPWAGSAGDAGSPGAAYVPAPISAATPTPVSSPTTVPTLLPTTTPTALPTTLPAVWQPVAQPGPLVIDEVYPWAADAEYIVLVNVSPGPLSLAGWQVGDAEVPGDGEGLYFLPAQQIVPPGGRFVLARNGAAFQARWGRAADAEIEASDETLPTLARNRAWARGTLALNNGGDEVVLLAPDGRLADLLVYGDGSATNLGIQGPLELPTTQSVQRVPPYRYPGTNDLRHRFLFAAPDPFASRQLPGAGASLATPLDAGLTALWGVLGASSTFAPGGRLPPHLVAAHAATMGLDYIALADPGRVATLHASSQPAILSLPAWRWQTSDGAQAIVYGQEIATLASWQDLAAFLAHHQQPAQAWVVDPPALSGLAAVMADDITLPGDEERLWARWRAAGQPLLPAGNRLALPDQGDGAPRYTGLAVRERSVPGVLEALAQRRGWLSSVPGLWLTLQTATGVWMGGSIDATNTLELVIHYGDVRGEAMGLALWQNGSPVQRLDLPTTAQPWRVTLPATPGFLYVVATQQDGDFAITAPLHVRGHSQPTIRINEVLPAPRADHNGDGQVNTDDEYVELFNPDPVPVTLEGWTLYDRRSNGEIGRRFVFGPGRVLGGRQRLLLWRSETGLSLNDDGDHLTLETPAGEQTDNRGWAPAPRNGLSLSRIPDGGDWIIGTEPTPGERNRAPPGSSGSDPGSPGSRNNNDDSDDDDTAQFTGPSGLPPTHGQASGPPGSLALAKLQGLRAPVEFRAQVTVPSGLFNSAVYVAEPVGETEPRVAGLGLQVYLQGGAFTPLAEGDWVLVRGTLHSFRGELEVLLDEPGRIWRVEAGAPLQPLPVRAAEIGESLEGRLITFTGVISGWQGSSLFLVDPDDPRAAPVRVMVRSSLDWQRPYVFPGEVYRVTGVVSQSARKHPWNGGYRVLPRYERDIVRIESE